MIVLAGGVCCRQAQQGHGTGPGTAAGREVQGGGERGGGDLWDVGVGRWVGGEEEEEVGGESSNHSSSSYLGGLFGELDKQAFEGTFVLGTVRLRAFGGRGPVHDRARSPCRGVQGTRGGGARGTREAMRGVGLGGLSPQKRRGSGQDQEEEEEGGRRVSSYAARHDAAAGWGGWVGWVGWV